MRRDNTQLLAGMKGDDKPLTDGGAGAAAYADAVATYLGFAVDKMADTNCSLCTWQIDPPRLRATFGRQGLPMTWDYAEANIFGDAAGDYQRCVASVCEVLERLVARVVGQVRQLDATQIVEGVTTPAVCADPPYYDNIGYSDLADFFYIWLRRSLGKIYPSLFSTLLTPKAQELIASPYRFDGNKKRAEDFFEEGLGRAFVRVRQTQHPDLPLTLYYAFKQAEVEEEDQSGTGFSAVASTGWETMLEGLLKAGFVVAATWALASSIVLSCRPRTKAAPLATRRKFLGELKDRLPGALKRLQQGNVAPVDLAQAAIGPGMAVFSRYSKVVEADGSPMRVRTALALINQTLDEALAEQEGEFDTDTRWAVAWFEQFGMNEGPFGVAETLSKAKNTAVKGLEEAGILVAKAGKVRLLRREELDRDWDPTTARRLTVWEVTHQLIRALEKEGEAGAAALLRRVGALGETARDLAYRLYGVCERKKWSAEALAYNSLVIACPEITRLARTEVPREQQISLGV